MYIDTYTHVISERNLKGSNLYKDLVWQKKLQLDKILVGVEYLLQYKVLEQTPDINHCRHGLQNLIGFGTPLGCKIRRISCSRLYFNGKTEKAPQITKKLLHTIIMPQRRKAILIWKCLVACCSCNTNDKDSITEMLRTSSYIVMQCATEPCYKSMLKIKRVDCWLVFFPAHQFLCPPCFQ